MKRKAKKSTKRAATAAITKRSVPATSDALSLGNIEASIAAYEKRSDLWGLLDLHARASASGKYVADTAKRGKIEHDDGVKAQGRVIAAILRIERGLGRMCARIAVKTPKKKRRTCADGEHLPTLDEVGITRKESSRWQKLADLPDKKFEERVAAILEKGRRVTFSAASEPASEAKSYDGDEHYTPEKYIELVRQVFGGEIDLDPASSLKAQETVVARQFYTKEQDGLSREWAGTTFLNMPYSDPAPWVEKLLEALGSGAVPEAIVLCNNTTDVGWAQQLLEASAAVCFMRGRIAFDRPDSKANKGTRQGQIFFYLGNDVDSFISAFEAFQFDEEGEPARNAILRPSAPLHVPDVDDEDDGADEQVDELPNAAPPREWFEDSAETSA